MDEEIIQISGDPIGEGQKRFCNRHPLEPGWLTRLQRGSSDKLTPRKLKLYRSLARGGMQDFRHIPKFYGMVETSPGRGFVVDLIADYDGGPSRSPWRHFERGYPVGEFAVYLDELRACLRDNRIVFSVDMGRYNILSHKLSPEQARLVVIERRWRRFITRLCNYSAETMRAHAGARRTLEAAYRRQG